MKGHLWARIMTGQSVMLTFLCFRLHCVRIAGRVGIHCRSVNLCAAEQTNAWTVFRIWKSGFMITCGPGLGAGSVLGTLRSVLLRTRRSRAVSAQAAGHSACVLRNRQRHGWISVFRVVGYLWARIRTGRSVMWTWAAAWQAVSAASPVIITSWWLDSASRQEYSVPDSDSAGSQGCLAGLS